MLESTNWLDRSSASSMSVWHHVAKQLSDVDDKVFSLLGQEVFASATEGICLILFVPCP